MKIKSFLGGLSVSSITFIHLMSAYRIFTSSIGLQVMEDGWWVVYFITFLGVISCWGIAAQMDEDHADLVRLRRKCNEPSSTIEALEWENEDKRS